MKSDEELDVLVAQIARDSPLDEWPDVLEYMLKRLDWIAYNSFPLPKPPPALPRPPVSISRESTVLVQSSEEQDSQATPNANSQPTPVTENDDPSQPASAAAAPTIDVEATQEPAASPPEEAVPSSQSTTVPSTQLAAADDSADTPIPDAATVTATATGVVVATNNGEEKLLPPTLKSSLAAVVQVLTTKFGQAPPHTVQRLAELLLKPTRHYRSLAKFLRAAYRVVAVTSGADKFPLPMVHDGQATMNAIPIGSGLVNEHDDAATGATLTPIPWASAREYVANANGGVGVGVGVGGGVVAAGLIEGDSAAAVAAVGLVGDADVNGGISQGELLRREQEAGVVPASQVEGSGGAEDVYVTGPPELGAADVGPQPEGTVFGPAVVPGAAIEGGEEGEGEGEGGGGEGGENVKEDEMDVDEKVEDIDGAGGEKGAEKGDS
ncbi:hypothetical protein DRE_01422 [Drechslerella stenobrocha 248]|uniref:Uncharacterized protein n=1 Tax=Drechslerella stenobrocha 248 TaxID=1043628 RepID=W7I490_9PEZI|nr:hypothetical protein DRE_01422 [Drechslerella stenobrocha 248]